MDVFFNNSKNLYFDFVIFIIGFLLILPNKILKTLIEMNKLKMVTKTILFTPSIFENLILKLKLK